jgi:3-oxoacyl-[acyl-carrier-protein] synthase II
MSSRSDRLAAAVVTGVGIVSAIGSGREEFWESGRQGYSGVRDISRFDTSSFSTKVGCEVKEAAFRDLPGRLQNAPRATRLGSLAALQALEDARCGPPDIELLCVGTTLGDLPDAEVQLADSAGPSTGLAYAPLTDLGGRLAASLGVHGGGETILTACSAGNVAIVRAVELISHGLAERVLAGGAEAFSRSSFIGFSRMRAMAKVRCRPFSRERDGMLLGEGAAFLVIETIASAERRKVTPLATISGYGLTCDAKHIAVPDGEGAARAMEQAIHAAGISPQAVDFVCAHGTGTQQNDAAEARACAHVFGSHRPSVASIKALIGHALGASSAIEAAACGLSLAHQEQIPQWEIGTPDTKCELRLALPEDQPRAGGLNVVLNNAFAFGGNNSCLIMERAR